ncbi:MAG: hypothetical protein RR356_01210 [Bacteroidales bacterium]
MKKLLSIAITIFSLASVVSSCEDIQTSETSKGSIIINGASHDLYRGTLFFATVQDSTGASSQQLVLDLSSMKDLASIEDVFTLLSNQDSLNTNSDSVCSSTEKASVHLLLTLHTQSLNKLDAGSYHFTDFGTIVPYTFNGIWGHQISEGNLSQYGLLNSGNFTVSIDGDIYTLTFQLTDSENNEITGNYTGTLAYISGDFTL